MINIVKIDKKYNFYDGRNKTSMDNIETISAIIRAFDNAGIDYNIIEDIDGTKTEDGTIKKLFK